MSPAVMAALALGLAATLVGTPARAQAPYELEHDVAVDVAVTGTAIALAIGSELAKSEVLPRECRWCDRDDNETDSLNALDRAARRAALWSNPHEAQQLSDVIGLLVTPGTAFGLLSLAAADERAGKALSIDVLIVLQAAALSQLTNQIAKFAVGRERPFVHVLAGSERGKSDNPLDENVSFYSGHSALVFSLATAAGTVASMRGYRLAPLVWAVGMPLAASTAYLRVAGDKHYLTDVVAGSVMGAAFGALVPLLFHARKSDDAAVGAFSPGVVSAPSAPIIGTSGTF
jgi:membrane-associated phospholipid phosphatase